MTSLLRELVTGTWPVDAVATSARFTARDVLRKPVHGILPVLSGGVEVSPGGLPEHVWADLDLRCVDTGNARRDRDLRGPRFFDVEKGGVLSFSATDACADGDARWVLNGELGLSEKRCPLPVQVEIAEATPGRMSVRAAATLDLRDIGITVPGLLVGRRVAIAVHAVLTAPRAGERA